MPCGCVSDRKMVNPAVNSISKSRKYKLFSIFLGTASIDGSHYVAVQVSEFETVTNLNFVFDQLSWASFL